MTILDACDNNIKGYLVDPRGNRTIPVKWERGGRQIFGLMKGSSEYLFRLPSPLYPMLLHVSSHIQQTLSPCKPIPSVSCFKT